VKHLMRIALCAVLASAVAASAVPVASAALPEFVGPLPQSFSSKIKASTLETVGGLKITCTAGTDAGQVTGPQTLTVAIKLSGCLLNGASCSSSGAPGEIETSTLTGTLGYIKAAKKKVGVDLASPGAPIIAFGCLEDLRVIVTGSVIGKLGPVDTVVAPPKHFTLHFAQKAGKQKPTKFEAGPTDVLETSLGGPFEESGLAAGDALTFAVPLEIRA
jgi:hypothetical protein